MLLCLSLSMANLCTGNMVIFSTLWEMAAVWAKIWRMNRNCLGEEFFHASKVMFKILQVRLHHYMNQELTDVQAGFIKGRGTRDQIANIHWRKQGNSRKTSTSVSLTTLKPLWIIKNCGKLKEVGISDHLTCLLRNVCESQEATVRTLYGTSKWLVQDWERGMTRLFIVTLFI